MCILILAAGCWKTIQERIDGSESFDRTMAEYASGFGTAGKNFWLGLDTISEKTLKCKYSNIIQIWTDPEGNIRLYGLRESNIALPRSK